MKRVFIAVLAAAVLAGLSITGCSSDTSVPEEIPTTETGGTLPVDNTSGDREESSVEWKADGVFSPGEYLSEYNDESSGYEIRWNTDDEYIYFGIRADTEGWLAIGLEPEFRMNGADMIIGMVKEGETVITDQFSTGVFGPHIPDTELGGTNDILEYGGREEGGITVIEFKRLLATGDEFDNDVSGDSLNLIWSFGSTDDFTRKHVVRAPSVVTIDIIK